MSTRFTTTRSTLAPLALVLGLCGAMAGCSGSGAHVREGARLGQQRLAAVKSGVELQMAQQQFLAGDLDKARRTTEGVLAVNPEFAKAHLLYGRILLEQSDLEGARAAFVEAQRLDADEADARYYQGIVYERFSQPDNAMTEYRAAMTIEPANAQYVVAAGEMLVQAGRLDEAEALMNDQKDSLAHSAAVRQTLGRIAMMRGEHAKAAQYFNETRLLAPDDRNVLEDLVRAQAAAKQWSDAEFNASVLMRSKGYEQRRDLMHIRAQALLNLNRLTDARGVLTKLTEGDEGERDIAAWTALGKVCVALRDWGRVRMVAGRMINLAPDRAEGYLLNAMALRDAGEQLAALRRLDQALERRPDDADALVLKALTLQDLGRFDGARQSLERALEVHPDNQRAAQLLQTMTQTATVPTDK